MASSTLCELCDCECHSGESRKKHTRTRSHKRELRQREKLAHARPLAAESGPLTRFFHSYSRFEYDPLKCSAQEFQRLRILYGWRRGNPDGERAWSSFRVALVKEFNRLFGTDSYDLLAWQNLCELVGVQSRSKTREECIEVSLVTSSSTYRFN